jgi:hypothetical protein
MSNDWREDDGEEALNFDFGKRKGKDSFLMEEDEHEDGSEAYQEEEDGDLLHDEDAENSFALYDATSEDEEFGYQM